MARAGLCARRKRRVSRQTSAGTGSGEVWCRHAMPCCAMRLAARCPPRAGAPPLGNGWRWRCVRATAGTLARPFCTCTCSRLPCLALSAHALMGAAMPQTPLDACPPAACCAWHSVTSHCPLRRWSLPRCVALCRSGVRAGVFEHRTEGGLAHGGATPCRTGNRTSSGWLCGGRRVGGLALLAPAVAGRAAAAAGRDPKGSLLQPTPPHLSLLSNPNARHTHRCSAPLPAATARAALPQAVATAH